MKRINRYILTALVAAMAAACLNGCRPTKEIDSTYSAVNLAPVALAYSPDGVATLRAWGTGSNRG